MSDSVIPWTVARQASLSITNSQSLLKLMSRTCCTHTDHPLPQAREENHTDPFLFPQAQKQTLSVFLLLRSYYSFHLEWVPSFYCHKSLIF